jgi:hypothetical protein
MGQHENASEYGCVLPLGDTDSKFADFHDKPQETILRLNDESLQTANTGNHEKRCEQ